MRQEEKQSDKTTGHSKVNRKEVKAAVFWDIAVCSLVEINRRFRGTYCFHHQSDNRGSKHLFNIGQFLRDYTASVCPCIEQSRSLTSFC
jgi:hypothetical protein